MQLLAGSSNRFAKLRLFLLIESRQKVFLIFVGIFLPTFYFNEESSPKFSSIKASPKLKDSVKVQILKIWTFRFLIVVKNKFRIPSEPHLILNNNDSPLGSINTSRY